MKRITIIVALLVAFMLPVLAHAQSVRTIRPSWLPPDYAGTGGAEYGGNYDAPAVPPPTSAATRPRTLADDLDAGINFGATNNPILACSGLDIRDSIKAMFNMDSLVADVKNYLTSYMAKQALSMVYANPAIAGVLDGLKAFGNARFQLAQTSCEAIEGEISEQSRFLRQQAFEECKRKNGDDGKALLKCSTETGSYAAGLNDYVTNVSTAANNKIDSWVSGVNVGGPDYKAAMCAKLSEHSPAACAKTDGPLAGMGQPVMDEAGNFRGFNSAAVSPKDLLNNGFNNALGASLVYMGMLMTALEAYGADEIALNADLDKLAAERRAAYEAAMKAAGGRMLVSAVRDIYDRSKGEKAFVTASRENAVRYGADIESRYSAQGCRAEELNGPISGVHGNNGQNPSYHYTPGGSQAIDFNCRGGNAAQNAATERQICEEARSQPGVVNARFEPAGVNGSTGDHCHVAFGSPTEGPGTYAGMLSGQMATAAAIVDSLTPESDLKPLLTAKTPQERYNALKKMYKAVPLIVEDACYYDLDLDKEDLEDISDINNIFAATTEANQKVEKERNKGTKPQEGGAETQSAIDSINARIQELKMTSGRLALCNVISYVDRLDVLKLQFRKKGTAFMRGLAEEAGAQATAKIYDALIGLVDQAVIRAKSSDAPPKMADALMVTRASLETSRDSVIREMDSRKSWAERKAKLNQDLDDSNAQNAATRAAQGRSLGRNLGPQ